MKAIVAVDGSAGSWQALADAVHWLADPCDQVLLYYAPPALKLASASKRIEGLNHRARTALVESIFREALQRLPAAMRSAAQTVVGADDPRRELPKIAAERHADLIILGARGRGGLRGILLGSVSQALARHTEVPLLVARSKSDKACQPGSKVLMAVDEIPASRETLAFLEHIVWPAHAAGRLMHVVEPEFAAEVPHWLFEQAEHAQDEELARAYLEQQQRAKREKFDELSAHRRDFPKPFAAEAPIVLAGDPAQRIIETAYSDDVDLIVIGSKGLSGFERFMLGSTAERVLAHAPCSVLLLPHRGRKPSEVAKPEVALHASG